MIKILKDNVSAREEIFSVVEPKVDVTATVKEIIDNVIKNGDKALYEYAEKFDKVKLDSLIVTKQEIIDAVNSVDSEFIRVLERAKENITEFHTQQVRKGFEIKKQNGVVLGQKIIPI